jgi:hypothetical protein
VRTLVSRSRAISCSSHNLQSRCSMNATCAVSVAIEEEGALIFSAVKIRQGYGGNADIVRMCKNRIRVPRFGGTTIWLRGAARIAERELPALARRSAGTRSSAMRNPGSTRLLGGQDGGSHPAAQVGPARDPHDARPIPWRSDGIPVKVFHSIPFLLRRDDEPGQPSVRPGPASAGGDRAGFQSGRDRPHPAAGPASDFR